MEHDDAKPPREKILQMLHEKSNLKQKVYDNTLEVFQMLKECLHEFTNEVNEDLVGVDKRVRLEYRDRGQFEAEIRVAGDLLVFSMHTNIFDFDRSHKVRKLDLVQKDRLSSYCGVINIYNFLADSFKYNRTDDIGYLIGRIFVNKDHFFFVEGKRQHKYNVDSFGKQMLTEPILIEVVETAVRYALEFDLLSPPYEDVKEATVSQINSKIGDSMVQTGKRLGFRFNADDVK